MTAVFLMAFYLEAQVFSATVGAAKVMGYGWIAEAHNESHGTDLELIRLGPLKLQSFPCPRPSHSQLQ